MSLLRFFTSAHLLIHRINCTLCTSIPAIHFNHAHILSFILCIIFIVFIFVLLLLILLIFLILLTFLILLILFILLIFLGEIRVKSIDPEDVIERIFSPTGSGVLPESIPLPQMVDILIDFWEADGLFD